MPHRLLVVCLGGLAGGGALVCCDLDEGLDTIEAAPDDAPAAGALVEEAAPAQADSDAAAIH